MVDDSPRIEGLDKLTAAVRASTDTLHHIGDTAAKVGEAADKITTATQSPKIAKASRSLRLWGAASFASLLDLVFGRR